MTADPTATTPALRCHACGSPCWAGTGAAWPPMSSAEGDEMTYEPLPGPKPTVVCLCGSTRFGQAFKDARLRETLAGKIVLTIGTEDQSDHGLRLTPETKEMLDRVYLWKIEMADEILVLNLGGYVGDSTRREIRYAGQRSKRIRWLDPEAATRWHAAEHEMSPCAGRWCIISVSLEGVKVG
jgi:hypothetical protein